MFTLLLGLIFAFTLVAMPIALLIVVAAKWPKATEQAVLGGIRWTRNRQDSQAGCKVGDGTA